MNEECESSRDNLVIHLFQSFDKVPDIPLLQSAMMHCVESYAKWLPTFVCQSTLDPLSKLLPTICGNLSNKDLAQAAAKAFCSICESCALYMEPIIPLLNQVYGDIIHAANVSHGWIAKTTPSITLTEHEALNVRICYIERIKAFCVKILSSMVVGVSQVKSDQTAVPFLNKIFKELLQSIRWTRELPVTSIDYHKKMTIQIARLKVFFASCERPSFNSEIIS